MNERARRTGTAEVSDLEDRRALTDSERQQAAASADAWAQWSNAVNVRIGNLETRLEVWLGGSADGEVKPGEVPAVVELIGQMLDADIAKLAPVEAVKAMREEMLVEVALLRDEINGRIDRKLYGSGVDIDAEEIRALVFELRRDGKKAADTTAAQLEELARRVDASDARRRADRQASKEATKQDVLKIAAVFGASVDRLAKRLDGLDGKIDALRNDTAEALDDR